MNHKDLRISLFLFISFNIIKYIISQISSDLKYPVSLTLYNDNILLISKDKITFYDSSLENIIKQHNISEKVENYEKSVKTSACQYPQEFNSYILVFNKDQLYFFDKEGNKMFKNNFTLELGNIEYYELIPIKKVLNELYYIIVYTNSVIVKFLYYSFNIEKNENFLFLERDFTPKFDQDYGNIGSTISCTILKTLDNENVLTCIYSGSYPCEIQISSFSLDNITELNNYSTKAYFNESSYINYFKILSPGNKSKAYIAIFIYQNYGHTAIYELNSNKLSSIKKRVEQIGSHIRCINFIYFQRTKQFILSFRDNYRSYKILILNEEFDVIFNEVGEFNFIFDYEYISNDRETFVYLKNKESYFLLSDAYYNGEIEELKGNKLFQINFTAKIDNNYTEYEDKYNTINYDEKSEYIIEKEEEKDIEKGHQTQEINEDIKTNKIEEENKTNEIIEKYKSNENEIDNKTNEIEIDNITNKIEVDSKTNEITNENIIDNKTNEIEINNKTDIYLIDNKTYKIEEQITNENVVENDTNKIEEKKTNEIKIEFKTNKIEEQITNENVVENDTNKIKEQITNEIKVEFKTNKIEEQIITNEIKDENEKEISSNNLNEDKFFKENETYIIYKSNNSKCLYSTEESNKMNLCIKCNNYLGYYPVNFKKNIFPNNFIECFNNNTKLSNFYFNEKEKQYEPCYETCSTCNYGGNEEIHNCTSCDIGSIFRPETNGTTNCVKKCKYRYYYTSYGQYKCSNNDQCPQEAKFYVNEKSKCIENCILDDIYKYQYDGECLMNCPNDTISENNVCIINNKNKCSYKEYRDFIKDEISSNILDLLAMKYAKEFKFANNHVSSFISDSYSITIYKNKFCINNLSITIPKIDFGSCYEKINNNFIDYNLNLIILIIEKYYNGSSIVLYRFYDPLTGEKIETANECQNLNVIVQKNITTLLKGTDSNIEAILKLSKQNINVFNRSSDFYNDVCFNYESPNGKDIPLKDRLKEFYPDIILCDEGCLITGVNLTSMEVLCQCKFSDGWNGNIITQNAFVSKIIDEFGDIFLESNLLLLQCYKNIFSYKYFIKNTGGFIMLALISLLTLNFFIFTFIYYKKMNKYIYMLMEIYFSSFNNKYFTNNKINITSYMKTSPPRKKEKSKSKILVQNNSSIINLTIGKIEIHKNSIKEDSSRQKLSPSKSSISNLISSQRNKIKSKTYNLTKLNRRRTEKSITKKHIIRKFSQNSNKIYLNKKDKIKINKYIEGYLATDADDLEYDYAVKLDKRTFFQYFWEKLKINLFFLEILLVNEQMKPWPIKLTILLINIDLYFLINGLFMNEDYISEVYHSKENESIFNFVERANNNLFYTSMVGVISGYLITCFILEEKIIKNIFKREKRNILNIKYKIFLFSKNIKSRYSSFFITSYIIAIFSWYYLSCFNNVYPYTKNEWIISSIFIFLVMQIFHMILALVETILRFLSFRLKSEKLFKISEIFN